MKLIDARLYRIYSYICSMTSHNNIYVAESVELEGICINTALQVFPSTFEDALHMLLNYKMPETFGLMRCRTMFRMCQVMLVHTDVMFHRNCVARIRMR